MLPGPDRRSAARERIRAARAFFVRWRWAASEPAREALARDAPDLYHATLLAGGDDGPRAVIEARILARQPMAEIAARTGVPAGAIAVYEALYFHVTDRLDSKDWVFTQVILPALARQISATRKQQSGGVLVAPLLDGTMKLFGY